MGYEAPIVRSTALAPNATFAQFQKLLHEYAGYENVLIVGHNPNLTGFLASLLEPASRRPTMAPDGRSSLVPVRLRKGSIARLNVDRGPATLQWLIDQRTVRALYATSTARSRSKTSRK
jgi:phosphohistidine phosphatase